MRFEKVLFFFQNIIFGHNKIKIFLFIFILLKKKKSVLSFLEVQTVFCVGIYIMVTQVAQTVAP